MAILYDSTNMSRIVTILWDNLIQLTCLDLSKAIRWWNTLKFGVPKFEQMADEMLSETKWFLGSLRASRAIKNYSILSGVFSHWRFSLALKTLIFEPLF